MPVRVSPADRIRGHIDELFAVIRRVVGGSTTMRAQLEHIAEIADLTHVTVQMLPFRAGAHPAMDGSFIVLGFPEPADPDVVYRESQAGSPYLERPPEVERYAAMFNHLIAKALDPDESRALVARGGGRDDLVSPREARGMDAPEFDPSRAVWRTSSFSNNAGACVEVADNRPGLIAVRDSKDRSGPILLLTASQWREFITDLCANAVSVVG